VCGLETYELAIAEMKRIFEDAQREITFLLANYEAMALPGYEIGRQRVLLKQVEEILEKMDEPVLQWAERWLPRSYSQGSLYVTKSLRKMGLVGDAAMKAGFSVVDTGQVYALAESLVTNLDAIQAQVLHKVDLAIRRSQLALAAEREATRTIARGTITGRSIPGMQRDLLNGALRGQIAPGGYRGTMTSYAELLARTRTREAQMTAALRKMDQFGVKLVTVPKHGGACALCAPWQGAIFSLDGSDPRFPPLSVVGLPPWHPNCADVIAPFVEKLASTQEIAAGERVSTDALRAAEKAA